MATSTLTQLLNYANKKQYDAPLSFTKTVLLQHTNVLISAWKMSQINWITPLCVDSARALWVSFCLKCIALHKLQITSTYGGGWGGWSLQTLDITQRAPPPLPVPYSPTHPVLCYTNIPTPLITPQPLPPPLVIFRAARPSTFIPHLRLA